MASAVGKEGRPVENVMGSCRGCIGDQRNAPGETEQTKGIFVEAAGPGQSKLGSQSLLQEETGSDAAGGVNNRADVDDAVGNEHGSNCLVVESTQSLSDASISCTPNDCPGRRVGRPRKKPRPGRLPTTSVPPTPPPSLSSGKDEEQTPKPQKKRGRKSKVELLVMAQQKKHEQEEAGTPSKDTASGDQEMTPSGRPKRRAATVAMKYLQFLAEELESHPGQSTKRENQTKKEPVAPTPTQKLGKGKKRKRRGLDQDSDDATADADFVPENREEAVSEGEVSENDTSGSDDDDKDSWAKGTSHTTKSRYLGCAANGLSNSIMGPIWSCTSATKEFREEHYSSWVFPEWIPTAKDWNFLSAREAEKYLPQQEISPSFKISREGLSEVPDMHRLPRFGSQPAHTECWDSVFFVGGPVWSMEWCPCPDGATAANQYAAIYCNRGMDDRHNTMGVYSEPTLLQIWDLGELSYDTCPTAPAHLAYALAMEDGCIWDMKWCPSGAWELPTTPRKSPLMPRLGLLATAFSCAKIAIYSLPHPDALLAYRKTQTKGFPRHNERDWLIGLE